MPTEIKVVLPTPGLDDILSVTDALSTSEEDNLSINEYSLVEEIDVPENTNNNNAVLLPDDGGSIENRDEIILLNNVNTNPTTPRRKSPPPAEQKLFQRCNVKNVSLDKNISSDSCGVDRDSVARRVRSAKIENLFHQPSRESLVTCVRNDIHKPQSLNHQRSKKNGNPTNQQTRQQNQKRQIMNNNFPKVQNNKSSQTGDDENERCELKEDQLESKFEDGKSIKEKTSPKKQIRPSSSPARLRQRPASPKLRTVQNVKLAITGTYDIELEHRDIMMKALNSYHQHRRKDKTPRTPHHQSILNTPDNNEGNNDDNDAKPPRSAVADVPASLPGSDNPNRHSLFRDSSLLRDILDSVGESSDKQGKEPFTCNTTANTPRSHTNSNINNNSNNNSNNRVQLIYDDDKIVSRIWTDEKKREAISKRNYQNLNVTGVRGRNIHSNNNNARPASSMSSFDSDKTFKLARCRLMYKEEPKKSTSSRPKSSRSWTECSSRLLDHDASSGVLVDSVGHVYGRSKPRPLSALPCKFHMYLQDRNMIHYDDVGGRGGWTTDRRHGP